MTTNYQQTETFSLQPEDISKLLLLEDSHKKDKHNNQVVSQLIELYTRLVEYYDLRQDPIKAYFVDKMQSCVLRFNRVEEKQKSEKFIRKLKRHTQSFSENLFKGNTAKLTKDIETEMKKRRTLRGKEIKMAKAYRGREKTVKSELKQKLQVFKERSQKNTEIVGFQLQLQTRSINEKLRERRQQSLNRSLQKTLSRFPRSRIGSKAESINLDTQPILTNIYDRDNKLLG